MAEIAKEQNNPFEGFELKPLPSHVDNSVPCTFCPKLANFKIKTLAEFQFIILNFYFKMGYPYKRCKRNHLRPTETKIHSASLHISTY